MPKNSKTEYSKWLTVTLPDGTKKELRFRGKTEKEAEKKRNIARAEYEAGVMFLGGETPFYKWAQKYIDTYITPRYRPSGAAQMANIINNYFVSDLGALPMKSITKTHLQNCMNRLQGKSPSLINKAHGLLRGIFQLAYAEGIIPRDITYKLTKPTAAFGGGRRELTEQELEAFFHVYHNSDHQFKEFFGIILGSGLRPGEVRALTVPKIDFKSGTIKVDQAVKQNTKAVDVPKTNSSYREIPIADWQLDGLKSLVEQKKKSGDTCLLLFHGADNKPISEQRLSRGWSSFLNLMDIAAGAKVYRNQIIEHALPGHDEITPYYLRHTFATHLMAANVDIKTAMYFMGHSTPDMLLKIYSHVTAEMTDNARRKMVEFSTRKTKENPRILSCL